ncbi:U6 snRNA-associated Sm-like protein LSm2 [Microsporum canis]
MCVSHRGRSICDHLTVIASHELNNADIYLHSFFKTLTNRTVTIELKNDIRIRGTLKSVDQYLNIKLDDIEVLDLNEYPHLSSVRNVFIRGSVVRYIVLPQSEVDTGLLEDATRRGPYRGGKPGE